tara:strand:- start:1 stop:1092 length:1092 start_codon:yes stop_codon:yes gene_type:complete
MKIKKFLQNVFKKFFQFLFKIVYGKVIYSNHNLENKNIVINQLNNSTLRKFNNEAYSVYSISEGRVYNDTVENVAIINQNQIIDKISYQQQSGKLSETKTSIILEKGTPKIKKKIKSNLLILSQGASGNDNYFHWLFDILPKIKICSEVYNLENIENFYFSKLHKWQKNILEILDLKNIKILDSSIYRHVQASKIIAVEHPWYEKGYINEEAANIPGWIVNWLKETFLTKAENFDANDKVFIDRRDDTKFNHCQIINDEEVFQYLKSKGFSKYKVGQLSFKNQIHLFHNAKIIIGPHGAAFANLAFCKPQTKVIEFKPFNHPTVVNKRISEINDLNYQSIEAPDFKNEKGDILIDLNMLKKII